MAAIRRSPAGPPPRAAAAAAPIASAAVLVRQVARAAAAEGAVRRRRLRHQRPGTRWRPCRRRSTGGSGGGGGGADAVGGTGAGAAAMPESVAPGTTIRPASVRGAPAASSAEAARVAAVMTATWQPVAGQLRWCWRRRREPWLRRSGERRERHGQHGWRWGWRRAKSVRLDGLCRRHRRLGRRHRASREVSAGRGSPRVSATRASLTGLRGQGSRL